MSTQPVSYFQTDPRWGSLDYSAPGEKTTVRASGCGPTALAMVFATWVDKSITPKTECLWAQLHGYKAPHSGTYYSYFVPACKRFGLKCRQLNYSNIYGNSKSPIHDIAKQDLDKGNLVIACMGKGNWTSSGHYVLVWAIKGNTVYINDPASSRTARVRGNYSLFKKQVKYYWVVENPNKHLKEEDEMIYFEKESELPDYARDTVIKLVKLGLLNGNSKGLHLSEDMIRILTVMDRAKAFD